MRFRIITLIMIGLLFTFLGYLGYSSCIITKKIIFEKWIPAAMTPAVAGVILIWLIPWANHKYWQMRTQNERKWADEKFKKEIISNAAEFIEGAFFYMERLAELKAEENKLSANVPSELREEQYLVQRLRLKNEMGIGKMARLIELYFAESVLILLTEWIGMYNDIRSKYKLERFSEDHPLVTKAKELLKAMREEIDGSRNK